MDINDVKMFTEPDLQDALSMFNTDTPNWYGWIDWEANGEVYSNVKSVIEGVEVPSEADVNAKLAELQAIWNAQNAEYVIDRKNAYKPITEQLDMLYKDTVNGTTTWKDHITQVKSDNPKPA